ncbi:MAG: hypothetical protein ACRES5_34945 [Pseudomonas sp.]
MNTILPVFFDHSRHKLWVDDLDAHLDVLAFHGEEHMSQALTDAGRFPGWIKDCRHFVAAHEQRLCFPFDEKVANESCLPQAFFVRNLINREAFDE